MFTRTFWTDGACSQNGTWAGGYGVVVLDKATGKELCHRIAFNGKQENGKWKNGNSANYVTIGKDGYIFVAYGQSRVQVFKLTSTTK